MRVTSSQTKIVSNVGRPLRRLRASLCWRSPRHGLEPVLVEVSPRMRFRRAGVSRCRQPVMQPASSISNVKGISLISTPSS